jgi:hypothetical protein
MSLYFPIYKIGYISVSKEPNEALRLVEANSRK